MTYAFRAIGWTLFGIGVLIFIFTGGFSGLRAGSKLTMAGMLLMPIGMIATSLATVIKSWRAVRGGAKVGHHEDTKPTK